jgi:hypothetical protein
MLADPLPVAVVWILMIATVVAFFVFRGSTRRREPSQDRSRSDLRRKEVRYQPRLGEVRCQQKPGEDSYSYLVRCVDEAARTRPAGAAIAELERLIAAHPTEEHFLNYCRASLSDLYISINDLERAIACRQLPVTSRSAPSSDTLLSLKLAIGRHITGRDVLTLNGPKVTPWGREHLDQIEQYLDASVAAVEKHEQVNLLERWKESSHACPYPAQRDLRHYSFSRNPEVVRFIAEMTREAENTVREGMSFPRVGEGWVAETQLYRDLCHAFPSTDVVHHASPPWLGKQHLDVFLPEYAGAVEYQGVQHDKPVAHFGGEVAHLETRRRDEVKERLCTANGVRMIYVREGYELPEVVREVEEKRLEATVPAAQIAVHPVNRPAG